LIPDEQGPPPFFAVFCRKGPFSALTARFRAQKPVRSPARPFGLPENQSAGRRARFGEQKNRPQSRAAIFGPQKTIRTPARAFWGAKNPSAGPRAHLGFLKTGAQPRARISGSEKPVRRAADEFEEGGSRTGNPKRKQNGESD
jgi:hypothetical protein